MKVKVKDFSHRGHRGHRGHRENPKSPNAVHAFLLLPFSVTSVAERF
jgi:hypothetical protein